MYEKDEYKATKGEISVLLNELNDQISVNEVMKSALCEWICEKVTAIDEACDNNNEQVAEQASESLQTIFSRFNGSICQVDDAFTILTSPRILSGECDLKQLREIKFFVSEEILKIGAIMSK